MLKKFLKNQKGLTLIELLVVVVILGIIAAIAVPSVGGMIDNSKKDAHIANAQQMINSARLYMTSNQDESSVTLADLISNDYLEALEDPDSGNYNDSESEVVTNSEGELVVTLIGSQRTVTGTRNNLTVTNND